MLIAALLLVGLVCYLASGLGVTAPLPLQIICLVCVCAAAYILVRFKLTSTTYMLRRREGSADEDDLDFCVSRGQGQRAETLECVLSLKCLKDAVVLEKGGLDRIREANKGIKVYSYTASLKPKERLALVFDDDGELSCIIIEPDARLRDVLLQFSKENKEKHR